MSDELLKKLIMNSPLGKKLQILEAMGIPIIDWRDGCITCPGVHRHSTPTRDKDTKVFVNARGAKIKCFHNSCQHEVDAMNAVLGGGNSSPTLSNGGYVAAPSPAPEVVPDPYVTNVLTQEYPWSYSKIQGSSPFKFNRFVSRKKHPNLLLSLFDPNDVLWIGYKVTDSGPGRQNNFKTAKQWMQSSSPPGNYICPNSFHPGSFSRNNESVKDRRFLVVESDTLLKDEVGSVFKWMMKEGHRLRAVVDTGGKSLHGWFDYPSEALIPKLKEDLTILACDTSMFKPSQAVRLPGLQRTRHTYQELIYLDQ